jgi:tetraacyldisaccharide 4'-kinase
VANADTWTQGLQRAWLARAWPAWGWLPVAVVFGALVALRRLAFRTGLLRSIRLGVPVVVVGNLVAGGAGKTPTVLAIVAWLRARGHTPGIVSRGHGRLDGGVLDVQRTTPASACGDEPLLLRLRSGAPVCVGRDRVAAGQALRRLHPQVDVIVSDDGLQHLRLARDVQVIVFDERGAGNGWLLPAGPLREPLPVEVPPRSLVLYNAARPSTALPGWTARRSPMGCPRWPAGRCMPRPAWRSRSASSRCCASAACRSSNCRCPTTTTSRPCPGPTAPPT